MCGIAGAWFPESVKETEINPTAILALMIAGQQHRGHEGAGIITSLHSERKEFAEHKDFGLVFDVITPDVIKEKYGHCGIAHNRYSTTGNPQRSNIQPFTALLNDGSATERLAVAHNGNLTSILDGLRPTDSDTWAILHNFDRLNYEQEMHLKVFQALKKIQGAFSLLFLHKDKFGHNSLILVRDPNGIRPLWLAKFKFHGEEIGYLAASETCAFDKIIGVEVWRPVKPGEIVIINNSGVKSFSPHAWRKQRRACCIFELIYFMHPTSIVETPNFISNPLYAWEIQEALGKQLSKENPDIFKSDFITPVPDSSKFHALGYSHQSGVPLEFAILRNHWVGRTFISPVKMVKSIEGNNLLQNIEKIDRKFSFLKSKFSKVDSVIVIDDSIVRGNTFSRIIKRINLFNKDLKIKAGIASPPVKYPCFLGIATPTKQELAWNNYGGVQGIKNALGLYELYYLNLKGLLEVAYSLTGYSSENWCTACFDGNYPVPIEREEQRRELE